MSDVAEKVKKIIAEHLGIDDMEKITEDAKFIDDWSQELKISPLNTRLFKISDQVSLLFCYKFNQFLFIFTNYYFTYLNRHTIVYLIFVNNQVNVFYFLHLVLLLELLIYQ